MFNIYFLASSILGGVLVTLFAKAAFVKVPSVFRRLGDILTSGASLSAIRAVFKREIADYSGKPLTRAQVVTAFPEGTWQREAYDDFKKILLDEEVVFPCIYATKGFKTDDQLYLFIDSDDLSDPCHIRSLATALTAYLPQAHDLGPNTSLVLLAKKMPYQRSIEEYNRLFWELLNGLAKFDTKPWPAGVPRDIDTAKWCLCFGGEPLFTLIQTPAHQVRRSRYAPGLTVLFQPRWVFNILFSTDAKRAGALAKVRALLAKYDPIPVSPELKTFGEAGSRECKKYFLLDENEPALCPYDRLSESDVLKV